MASKKSTRLEAIWNYLNELYPPPLPKSESKKKEIFEIEFLLLVFLLSLFFLKLIFTYRISGLFNEGEVPSIAVGSIKITYFFCVIIILSVFVEIIFNKRTRKDLGLLVPREKHSWIILLLMALGASLIAIIRMSVSPIEYSYKYHEQIPYELFFWVYLIEIIFLEEFFWRSVIQTKLERISHPTFAWVLSGILFGLGHIFTYSNEPFFPLSLLYPILVGWILGFFFIMTRSIIPGIIAHYILNYLPEIWTVFTNLLEGNMILAFLA